MPWLSTLDKDIVDDTGAVVSLRGVNAGGWLVPEEWMTPIDLPTQGAQGQSYEGGFLEMVDVLEERFGREEAWNLLDVYWDNYWTEGDFDNIKALGMNVIRLPFGYFNLTGTTALTFDKNALDFTRLDWFVSECYAHDIYVILDLHAAYGSQNGQQHSGVLTAGMFGNTQNEDNTVSLWEAVAEHYKDNSTVAGYDLLNEPAEEGKTTGAMQYEFYDRLYDAIRTVDARHTIYMESCWETFNLPKPALYGFENVVYEYHNYQWNDSDSLISQQRFVDSKMIMYSILGHDAPTLIGEFTCFNNADSWAYTLDAYNEAGLSWTMWTYKILGTDSPWGLFTGDPARADLVNDSKETITQKWQAITTQTSYPQNTWLTDVVVQYTYSNLVIAVADRRTP
jgi:aryl-phospho-beta-D-glucosidase BglC (GH1 family)